MDTRSNRQRNEGFLPASVFKFDHIEKRVQEHLKRVYGCLAISMVTASIGAYVHLFTGLMQAGFLTSIAAIGLMLWLSFTPKQDETKRLAIFAGFTFLTGMSLGPMMDMIMHIDPSIIVTAFLASVALFTGFSLAALFNTDRKFLYLGGFLISSLSFLCLAGILNIFLGSRLLFDVQVYFGLVVFCGFVMYDTQLIIEKYRMGDDDYIWHCVDLFIDFIQIFRRLMIILADKKESKKNKN